ncbi:CotH kinase family protein [Marinilongibacter aquaticus]|uniref:CotH kinase family protein n=1 Tax=Marinilongibacter aquaticus TaxID=2975157 RepID=UPI0021BD52E7|nr:CotH kinase family protein [Marinilongibacter aquaticus]UBM57440.1 CotH kinase family protein [Marinilongibacter aquaticus]
MKKTLFCLSLFATFQVNAQGGNTARIQSSSPLLINEVMASNNESALDEEGDDSDWIELFNTTSEDIDLNGYFLSDDEKEWDKFEIEGSLVVPANGRLVLWASGKPELGINHLDFSLSADGEWLGLVSPEEEIVDSLRFGKQKTDVSYGRETDGSDVLRFFSPSSYNGPNNAANAYLGFLEPPVFSHESGFYQSSFNLDISHENNDVEIYYSTDGSIPSPDAVNPVTYHVKFGYPYDTYGQPFPLYDNTYRSFEYSGAAIAISDPQNEPNKIAGITTTYHPHALFSPPNSIDKCRVINAVAYKEGYLPSKQVSRSYFFSANGNNPYQLPLISLNIQPDFLFDYQKGIYVPGVEYDNWRATNPSVPANVYAYANYQRRGDAYEYPANFNYLSEDLGESFEQNVGFRLQGATTRSQQMKSLRVYARTEYEHNELEYPFFEDRSYDAYKRLILHSAGQDYLTLIKDLSIQKAASHLNFDTQAGKSAMVFINGEIWGIHHIRERYDKHYFAQKYGVDEDNLDITKTLYPTNDNMEEGDPAHYAALSAYFWSHEFYSNSEYEYIQTQMDVDNFIDYHIAEIFFLNGDWAGGNNHGLWREKVAYNPNAEQGRDGRWRWFMYDVDGVLIRPWIEDNSMQLAVNPDFGESTLFLRKLLQNTDFKNKFVNRFSDMLNTSFAYDYVAPFILANKENLSHAIDKHIARWGTPPNYAYWESEIDKALESLQIRENIQRDQLRSVLGMSDAYTLTVEVSAEEAGFVHVNSIDILSDTEGIDESPYPWSGTYFKDKPFQIHARANFGYKFLHWEHNAEILTDSVLTINLLANETYRAVFEEDFTSENPMPVAFEASACGYQFTFWDEDSPKGSFPAHMAFVYMNEEDPTLESEIEGFTNGNYDYTSKTRISGLGEEGISFINTGSGREGYPDTKLGGAILSVNTSGMDSLKLLFTAGTVEANSREYNLRLQYRIGDKLPFADWLDENNEPVEYMRSSTSGQSENFELNLPAELMNREYVQILWRYYFTGVRNDEESGARDEIRLDDVRLQSNLKLETPVIVDEIYDTFRLIEAQNVVNPAVRFELEAGGNILLNPGFETGQGTVFRANIADCTD